LPIDSSGNYKLILSKEIKLDSICLIGIFHTETIRLKNTAQKFKVLNEFAKLDEVLMKDRVVTIKEIQYL
jgi:hypothetical protein